MAARDIRFRAWIKTTKEMITQETISDYILVSNGTGFGVIDASDDSEYGTGTVWLEDKDFELMQYTGLTDKNGVEIYEGDIVKTLKWGAYAIEFKELFDNEQGFSLGTGFDMHMNNGNEVEVIGNIHQNKHLL